MKKRMFRLLRADEIDVRIGQKGAKMTTLLLYKNARVDMDILDETVGPMNWQRRHYLVGENLHCAIPIWDDEKKCWVSKSDVGTESYAEKEKGEASDSFKRAGFNWGIGRELYTAPKIFVPTNKINWRDDDPKKTYDTFHVAEIEYKDAVISKLTIVNQNGIVLFKFNGKPDTNVPYADEQTIAGAEQKRAQANEFEEAKNYLFDTAKKYGFLPADVTAKFEEVKKKPLFLAEPAELLKMADWYNKEYGNAKKQAKQGV
jgi:hypothetical protein